MAVLFIAALVTASPLLPVERIDTNSPLPLVANASSLGIDLSGIRPPPQLKIQIGSARNPLPDVSSVYLLTLNLAYKLSAYPSDGKLSKAIIQSISQAPGYLLSMKGHLRDGGFEVNLMFWGLQFSMQWMVQARQPFYERAFTVLWDERYVGTISYTYSPPPGGVSGAANFSALATVGDGVEGDGLSTKPQSNAIVDFKFRTVPGAAQMDLSSITMTLLAGFMIINAYGVDSLVLNGRFQAGEAHYRPRIQLMANVSPPARTVPNWYTYNVPRSMLARLAVLYLLELPGKGKPAVECSIELLYHGKVAGNGVFAIPRGGASAVEGGGSNTATS